jgi:hypothetical protein
MKFITFIGSIAFAFSHNLRDDDYGYLNETEYYEKEYLTGSSTGSDNKYYDGSPMALCGGEFTDVEATLYPSDHIDAGDEAYFYYKYNAPFEVESGYILTSISFNEVPYPVINSTLCSKSFFRKLFRPNYEKSLMVDCPISTGQHSQNVSFTIPNDEGILKTKIAWFSDNGFLLLCLKTLVYIGMNHAN